MNDQYPAPHDLYDRSKKLQAGDVIMTKQAGSTGSRPAVTTPTTKNTTLLAFTTSQKWWTSKSCATTSHARQLMTASNPTTPMHGHACSELSELP